ncbi:MAG: ribosome modulation factor [Marinobacter sp.]|uniref:ribosome modulation factor n=1 Tax=Marinobacter sp. TaxID=50741 RepID=UPI00299F43A5|nr:ribosome modulation factor [Marinobacter sp.]MDX1755203.1 ribosome modulation factor [Marinobacter sp.]
MTRDSNLGWEVDTLNKAYRQGYLAATMGMDQARCPYRGDVVIAAWEAGWEDAMVARQEAAADDDLLSRIA